MIEYTQYRILPIEYLKRKISDFLKEDIPDNDKTTKGTIPSNANSTAFIQTEENIVFAGADIIKFYFGKGFSCKIKVKDGDYIEKSKIIASINGNSGKILSYERVLLNLLQRLCGIATLTREYVKIASPFNVRILDTRKTMPGLRLFDKYAVTVGGGWNHRLDLSSGILIKDNHIQAAGGITNAINKIKKKNYKLPIELEVENLEQIKDGLKAGVEGFLLDNMQPKKIKKCVSFIRSFPNGKNIFIEASGGITLKTLPAYVKTGIDAISVGALTHSAKAANIHIEFE
ncbi:MAG: carboxylating nicotinate-nucleotide diphosphorylase [Bacteroidetes bacterium]|nr:MAG: carboxylating nicotinate-nucleotide diphosphorylase [Bacteroidota bacterium]